MIERVVDNWLDNVNEKGFQVPYCYSLIAKGYKVIHLSRHCPMEMGKDIIALDPKGIPCAFQLKALPGRRIGKEIWRTDLMPQIRELIFQSIDHPSIDPKIPHRSFLVINNDIDEEVSVAIRQFNDGLKQQKVQKLKHLNLVSKGDLRADFLALGAAFWPVDIPEVQKLLSLYLEDGKGHIPKDLFSTLLEAVLPLENQRGVQAPSKQACIRAMNSCAILTSLATTNFSRENNHAALFEAWVMYCAYVLCLAEKRRLSQASWIAAFELGLEAIRIHLSNLCDEVYSREQFVEGNPFADIPFYRIRLTYLTAMVAINYFMSDSKSSEDKLLLLSKNFLDKHKHHVAFWGEYAVPQFLAIYLFLCQTDATLAPAQFLANLIITISNLGNHKKDGELASPYISAEEIVLEKLVRPEQMRKLCLQDGSYTIEALFQIYARHNLKRSAQSMWAAYSEIEQKQFVPRHITDYYRWHISEGSTNSAIPVPTEQWGILRTVAGENAGSNLPKLLKQFPVYYLAFLCVYPHRWNSSGVRWVDSKLTS